jgi:hypothetical protein
VVENLIDSSFLFLRCDLLVAIDDDALLPEVVFLSPIPEFGLKIAEC